METDQQEAAQPSIEIILAAMLRECRKDNFKYRVVALSCTADILEKTEADRFTEIFQIVDPLLRKVS